MDNEKNRLAEAAKRGFTLVELLVAIAILGILAAIGINNVVGNVEKAKNKAAKAGVDSIRGAITNYMLAKNKSKPPSDLKVLIESDDEEEAFLSGGEGALVDPWGYEYRLEVKGKKCAVICAGPNHEFGDDDDIRSDKIDKAKKDSD